MSSFLWYPLNHLVAASNYFTLSLFFLPRRENEDHLSFWPISQNGEGISPFLEAFFSHHFSKYLHIFKAKKQQQTFAFSPLFWEKKTLSKCRKGPKFKIALGKPFLTKKGKVKEMATLKDRFDTKWQLWGRYFHFEDGIGSWLDVRVAIFCTSWQLCGRKNSWQMKKWQLLNIALTRNGNPEAITLHLDISLFLHFVATLSFPLGFHLP